ncbi:MAG TPA: hypothetical protein VL284_10525 [Thermoanaerobaculia bacterium]|nr:hypothetical protein [Thermoanaerobaculia bacterium]
MKFDNASFLGRTLRRFGRFAIAIVSLVAFFTAGGIVYTITAVTMGVWFPKLTLLAAFGAAIGIYAIFDKLDLIPEDPDKLITLSLTTLPPANQPWVSSDFEKR